MNVINFCHVLRKKDLKKLKNRMCRSDLLCKLIRLWYVTMFYGQKNSV